MINEKITVVAEGTIYDRWEEVTVTWSMKSPSLLFEMMTSELMSEPFGTSPFDEWAFPPGTLITMYTGQGILQDTLMVAYVNEYFPSATPTQHKIRVVGRTDGQDIVDSSQKIDRPFINTPIGEVFKKLAAPHGVQIICDSAGCSQIVQSFTPRAGATVYAEMMRLAPNYGLTVMGLRTGGAIVVGAGTSAQSEFKDSGGFLLQGYNMLSMSGELSDAQRTGEVRAIGQSTFSNQLLQGFGLANDPRIRPTRSRTIIIQSEATIQQLQERAWHEQRRQVSMSVNAKIQVPGFRKWTLQGNELVQIPELWEPAQSVYVWSPYLKVDCQMLITQVEFHQDDKGGTTTTLTVIDPRSESEQENQGGGIIGKCSNDTVWGF